MHSPVSPHCRTAFGPAAVATTSCLQVQIRSKLLEGPEFDAADEISAERRDAVVEHAAVSRRISALDGFERKNVIRPLCRWRTRSTEDGRKKWPAAVTPPAIACAARAGGLIGQRLTGVRETVARPLTEL
jgi:hypothetical protein